MFIEFSFVIFLWVCVCVWKHRHFYPKHQRLIWLWVLYFGYYFWWPTLLQSLVLFLYPLSVALQIVLISTRIVFPLILFSTTHCICSLCSVFIDIDTHRHAFLLARGCFHTLCVCVRCAREHVYHLNPLLCPISSNAYNNNNNNNNIQPQQFLWHFKTD